MFAKKRKRIRGEEKIERVSENIHSHADASRN
jgi:hypothetical protein